jgi:hypothetical protein
LTKAQEAEASMFNVPVGHADRADAVGWRLAGRTEAPAMQFRLGELVSHVFELSIFLVAAAALAVGAVNLR